MINQELGEILKEYQELVEGKALEFLYPELKGSEVEQFIQFLLIVSVADGMRL